MIPLAVCQNLIVTCIYLLQIGMNHRYANRSQKMSLDCFDIDAVGDSKSTMMMLYHCCWWIVAMNNLMVDMNSQSSLRIVEMKVQAYYSEHNRIVFASAKSDYRCCFR